MGKSKYVTVLPKYDRRFFSKLSSVVQKGTDSKIGKGLFYASANNTIIKPGHVIGQFGGYIIGEAEKNRLVKNNNDVINYMIALDNKRYLHCYDFAKADSCLCSMANSPQNVYSLKDKYLTIRPNTKIIIDRSFVRLVAVTYIHDKDEVFTKYRPH